MNCWVETCWLGTFSDSGYWLLSGILCSLICALHTLLKAQMTSKKVVRKKRHQFLAWLFMPLHAVRFFYFRAEAPKTTFWIWSKFFKSQWKTFNLWFGKLAVKKLHQKRHKKWNKKLGQKLESFLNFFLFEAAWAFGKMCLVESWWYQKSRLWQGV